MQCIAEDKSDLLSVHFPRLLQSGFVISVIIFLEKQLTFFCRDLQSVENIGLSHKDLSGSTIERVKKYCEHVARVNLSISNHTLGKNSSRLRGS